jgi:hypothetical protein
MADAPELVSDLIESNRYNASLKADTSLETPSKLNGIQDEKIQVDKIQDQKSQDGKIQDEKIQDEKIQVDKILDEKIQADSVQDGKIYVEVDDKIHIEVDEKIVAPRSQAQDRTMETEHLGEAPRYEAYQQDDRGWTTSFWDFCGSGALGE